MCDDNAILGGLDTETRGGQPFPARRLSPIRTLAALGCLSAGLVPMGFANGVERDGHGARAMALGGASVASPEHPLEAVAANPAGFADGVVQLGGWGATVNGEFSNAAQSGREPESGLGAAPEFAISIPVGTSPVTLGLGAVAQAAAGLDWSLVDAPGGLDGVTSYGTTRHRAEFLAIRTVVGASLKLSDAWSVGVSGGATYNRNQLEAPYVFQSHPVLRGFKTLLDLETEGWGANLGAGVIYRANDRLQFGLSYRSMTSFETEGTAEGNAGVQLRSLGGAFAGVRPDFRYDARVSTALPQAVSAGVSWRATDRLRLVAQVDWLEWSAAFERLDVTLTGGNNADLNAFLGSDRIDDTVPLEWKDRFVYRAGAEFQVTEDWVLRAGYAFGESPVTGSTLTPMSAAILEHTLTAGVGWQRGSWGIGLAYQYAFGGEVSVDTSGLRSGEYSGSTTDLDAHVVGLTASYGF